MITYTSDINAKKHTIALLRSNIRLFNPTKSHLEIEKQRSEFSIQS